MDALLMPSVAILTGFLSIFALVPSALRNPPIDKTTFEKIKVGAKASEVYRIIGAPPGDYPTIQSHGFFHIEILSTKGTQKKWKGDCGMIFLWVDGNDLVINKHFLPPQ